MIIDDLYGTWEVIEWDKSKNTSLDLSICKYSIILNDDDTFSDSTKFLYIERETSGKYSFVDGILTLEGGRQYSVSPSPIDDCLIFSMVNKGNCDLLRYTKNIKMRKV